MGPSQRRLLALALGALMPGCGPAVGIGGGKGGGESGGSGPTTSSELEGTAGSAATTSSKVAGGGGSGESGESGESGGAGGSGSGGSTASTGGGGSGPDCSGSDFQEPCSTPGDTRACGPACTDPGGNAFYGDQICEDPGDGCPPTWGGCIQCWTPLVLSFDDQPPELVAGSPNRFDLGPPRDMTTDWPTARTPWLARDVDDNGAIDDGSELFGSMTSLGDGRLARNGFVALRALDADADGRITPQDAGFGELLLWHDDDGDRRSRADELTPLGSSAVLSIDLDYVEKPRCDARGNCEFERAPFSYRGADGTVRSGAVIDVHLTPRAP